MEGMDEMGCLVLVDHKDRGETKGKRETKEKRGPLDQGMVGWCTQGGGKAVVQVSQVPHSFMEEGLVEHGINKREEQPTISACPMIQTILCTNLEFKGTATCMQQSIIQGEDH